MALIIAARFDTFEQEKQNDIATLLRNVGGKEVERAHGRWNQGRWEDFDPLRSPHPQ